MLQFPPRRSNNAARTKRRSSWVRRRAAVSSQMTKSFDIALINPSDGFTPIQMKKLNENFRRLIEVASGKDENNEAIVRIAAVVQNHIQPIILDAAYPIGCLLLAKSANDLPRHGKWRQVNDYNGRFIRLNAESKETGGRASVTIEASVAPHQHAYSKQMANTTVKVDPSTASGAKEVIATLKDNPTKANTDSAGSSATQTISTIPPYVTLKLFERYE